MSVIGHYLPNPVFFLLAPLLLCYIHMQGFIYVIEIGTILSRRFLNRGGEISPSMDIQENNRNRNRTMIGEIIKYHVRPA